MQNRKQFSLVLLIAAALCFGAVYPRYLFMEGVVRTNAPIESILTASANQIKFRIALFDLNN